MMFKAIILICITIINVFASVNFAYSFDTEAEYAYLLDVNSNTVLFEKNSQVKMSPSSMTKILTAYVIFQNLKDGNLKYSDEFEVSENAWSTGGTKMFVALKSNVLVEDLIKGVITISGNDACKVLAEGIYGDEATFAEKMNDYAKKIGMENSNFKNSSGLPDDEHYSTAEDLGILSKAIIKDFPQFYHLFSETEFTYNNIHQYNKNTLLKKRGIDGLKTGHTEAGGYGIVVSAIRDGRRLIAVVNGLKTSKKRIIEADKLLNYGFSNYVVKKLYNANEVIDKAKVWMSNKEVELISTEDINVVLPKSGGGKLSIKLYHESPISAPIEKGQVLAQLHVFEDDRVIYTHDLVALVSIEKPNFIHKTWHKIVHLSKSLGG